MLKIILILIAFSTTANGATVDLGRIRLSEAIHILYRELDKSNFVLHSDILQDERLVTFRIAERADSKRFLSSLLNEFGYEIKNKSGIDFIVKSKSFNSLISVYKPRYRSVSYLSRNINSVFPGSLSNSRTIEAPESAQVKTIPPEGSAAALIQSHSDVVSFSATIDQKPLILDYLKKIDVNSEQVQLDGLVVEVQNSKTSGSAIKAFLSALSGFELSIGSVISTPYSSLKISRDNFALAISQLSANTDFKFLSSPSVLVSSGELAQFSVGQEVPTLGSVTNDNGNPVQSVDYKDSGLIFNVRPNVLDEVITLDLEQEISTFGRTETGVNNSPTLSKRSLKTKLNLTDGELVVIGGLQDTKINKSSASLFGRFLKSQENSESDSQIILIVRASLVGDKNGT